MIATQAHPDFPPQQRITIVHAPGSCAPADASAGSLAAAADPRACGAKAPARKTSGKNAKRAVVLFSEARDGCLVGGVWTEKETRLSDCEKPRGELSAGDGSGVFSLAPTAADYSYDMTRGSSGVDGQAGGGTAGRRCRSTNSGTGYELFDEGRPRARELPSLRCFSGPCSSERIERRTDGPSGREEPSRTEDRSGGGRRQGAERGKTGMRAVGSRQQQSSGAAAGGGRSNVGGARESAVELQKREADGGMSLEMREALQQQRRNEVKIMCVFCLMFALEVFVNFDSGVVPAILLTLQEHFHMDGAAAGLLGSLPYIGLVASSPFVGRGLTTFSPKWFCLITMVVNLLATGLLGLAYYKWMLFLSRLLIGLSQSGFSIYAPVWVDQFAPAEKLTLWMGLAQGGVVVGTMLGCVIAGSFDTAARNGVQSISWRYALLIQAIALFILLAIWLCVPQRFVDINMAQSLGDTPHDAAYADAAGAALLEEAEEGDGVGKRQGSAETMASASGVDSSPVHLASSPRFPREDTEGESERSPSVSGPEARRAGRAREAPEAARDEEESQAEAAGVESAGGKRYSGSRSRRLSALQMTMVPLPARRATADDEEAGRGGDAAAAGGGGAAQTGGAPRGAKVPRRVRSSECSSCESIPQFRKDLISNLLPLDFIATSPTFTRRASQTNPGPAPGSVNAARAAISSAATAGGSDAAVPRPTGDVPVTLLDLSDIQQASTGADYLVSGSPESARELTTLSRLGPPPSSSPEAAAAAAAALEEGRELLPGEGATRRRSRNASSSAQRVSFSHPMLRGDHRSCASVPEMGLGQPHGPRGARAGPGASLSLAQISARHPLVGGGLRASSISGAAEPAGGNLNRAGSTVSEVQYQMTFLTPHSTTLAFEAFNWAAGTADPLLLVRTDGRPQGAAEGGTGEVGGVAGGPSVFVPSLAHRRRSTASSSVSEHVQAARLPGGAGSLRERPAVGRPTTEAPGAATTLESEEAGGGVRGGRTERSSSSAAPVASLVGRRRRTGSDAEDRAREGAADLEGASSQAGGDADDGDWVASTRRRSTSSSTGQRRLTALATGGAALEPEPHVEALSTAPRTFGVWQSIQMLFESPIYVCVTVALCALFFEVTAIQFWSITYFQQELKVPGAQVLLAFNVTAATAPIVGVLAGGWFIDYLGGYKNEKGMLRTLLILGSWAVICLIFGLCASWVANFVAIICFIWGILFFGGGILPAATGIVIASVPLEVRAFGSGFCMMIYNVFGYVLGTLVPGAIIQAAGLTWGMRVVFLWSIFGVGGLLAASIVAWRLRIKPAYVSYRDEARVNSEVEIQEVRREE
ncbi:transporter, major facilitator family protein [Besnoitia besnoiti]|uniref:Transporter, major facilitator family protein n=1 Tax=Besnoitia besnoiti TaxID=94643 RepID=A0A2A9M2I2_BESBE|nr:transporter, major facilitator family protein [Besnoitia besnoiti]PFH32708.1 transporter, major facilitator family protein [Besnoitia besnoiti]